MTGRVMAQRFLLAIAVFLAALVVGLALFWHPELPEPALPRAVAPAGGDFTLASADGPVTLQALRGKVVLVYFGYTYCPDVCPTALAATAAGLALLRPEELAGVAAIFVSVDPERDTPERMAEYMAYFNPSFVGLSGTPDQIAEAATPFGIYYQKHEGTPASGYLVDHTATVNVLDREGRMRLVWPFGTEGDAMAADLKQMLK